MFAKIKTIFRNRNASFLRNFEHQSLNPNALKSFGHSECIRVKKTNVDNSILILSIIWANSSQV